MTDAARTAPAALAPSRYLLPRQPDPGTAPLRLLCFHHAGGTASPFTTWQARLGPSVAVLPVQLPGREHRAKEPRLHDYGRLLDELDDELGMHLTEPYALYGHSMGGLIAYGLAQRRRAQGRRLPEKLLVGAAPPPHARPPGIPVERVSDDELVAWMTGLGGTPDVLLRHPEWLQLVVGLLRDDLRLAQSRPYVGEAPLPVPVHVLHGKKDPVLTARQIAGWARHTSAGCRVHTLPGGHFFHRESPEATLRLVSALLAPPPHGREAGPPAARPLAALLPSSLPQNHNSETVER